MSLYMLAGQREQALRQYERCRDILEKTFKTPPGEETKALYQQILENPQGLTLVETSRLPIPETPLIGRQTELAALQEQLTAPECRLLTLLGAGGSGKTHLALVLAANLLESSQPAFEDGIIFVPLSTLHSIQALPLGHCTPAQLPVQ